MPATRITPTEVSAASVINAGTGVSEAAGDNTNGNIFVNDGRTFLQCRNPTGGTVTLTFTTSGTLDEGRVTLSDPTVSVAAGVTRLIGPFNTNVYGSDVTVTPSASGTFLIVLHMPSYV